MIESRHLGLVLPNEIPQLKSRLLKLAEVLEKSLDIDGIPEACRKRAGDGRGFSYSRIYS